MSEPVTQSQFFEGMRQLSDKIEQKHSNLRSAMELTSTRIELALAEAKDRVLTMEIERRHGEDRRKEAQADFDRRAGYISTGVTLLLGVVYFIGRIAWETFTRK